MKPVYMCEYCGNLFLEKEQAEQHEKECKRNPVNKTCYTCKNLIEVSGEINEFKCRNKSCAWCAECYPSSPNKECWENGCTTTYTTL